MAVQEEMTQISRKVLEATARIIGPSSAAAKALADADGHDGETLFYKYRDTIVVQKIPAIPKN